MNINYVFKNLEKAVFTILAAMVVGILFSRAVFSEENNTLSVRDNISSGDVLNEEYKIGAFDLLDIGVYQEQDLNKIVRVSHDGLISFPLIGKVKLAGLDIISAEEKIAALLEKDYLINPSVKILVKEYSTKKVFVLGEVKNPGSFTIPQDKKLTIVEAIALAGGFTNTAAADSTRVIRVENGIKKYIPVRVSDITKQGDKAKDIILFPNDIVFIPERVF